MAIAHRIAELEAALVEVDVELAKALARRQGLKAELESLRSGATTGDLASAARTEAIVSVLRAAGNSLSPTEILHRLHEAGRRDDLRSVTATLNHLVGRGAVQRPGRGQYLAV